MKKALLLFISILTITFTSCSEEEDINKDDNLIKTVIKVKITKDGKNETGKTVYIFDKGSSSDSTFKTDEANAKVKTDTDGIATFILNDIFNLKDEKTRTIYFAVSNGIELIDKGTTIKNEETKDIEIKI